MRGEGRRSARESKAAKAGDAHGHRPELALERDIGKLLAGHRRPVPRPDVGERVAIALGDEAADHVLLFGAGEDRRRQALLVEERQEIVTAQRQVEEDERQGREVGEGKA